MCVHHHRHPRRRAHCGYLPQEVNQPHSEQRSQSLVLPLQCRWGDRGYDELSAGQEQGSGESCDKMKFEGFALFD